MLCRVPLLREHLAQIFVPDDQYWEYDNARPSRKVVRRSLGTGLMFNYQGHRPFFKGATGLPIDSSSAESHAL